MLLFRSNDGISANTGMLYSHMSRVISAKLQIFGRLRLQGRNATCTKMGKNILNPLAKDGLECRGGMRRATSVLWDGRWQRPRALELQTQNRFAKESSDHHI
jgi:hypothetical protein